LVRFADFVLSDAIASSSQPKIEFISAVVAALFVACVATGQRMAWR
jgi:hypothetical protein